MTLSRKQIEPGFRFRYQWGDSLHWRTFEVVQLCDYPIIAPTAIEGVQVITPGSTKRWRYIKLADLLEKGKPSSGRSR